MPEDDENRAPSSGAEASEDDSADSFLRAAAQLPGDSGPEAGSATRTDYGFHEGMLVAKRYRLERLLGEGGMGIVWAAIHTVTGRSYALKFLKTSGRIQDELRRRFLREARVATAIDHPNVVQVRDVFELEDGTPVMVMALLSGETLGSRLARERRLSVEQAATLLLPVASAVGTAHALGIVHRDLKPENVFLARDRATGECVKVLDFGVAKLADSATELQESGVSTETGAVLGTARYMAPEQALGERDVDHRADIWALGVILYECLSGERPIKGLTVGHAVLQMMGAGVEPLSRLVPGLPLDVTSVVMRMLARDRALRPDSLHEVSEVLARYTSVRAPAFGQPMYSGQGVAEAFAPTLASGAQARPRTSVVLLVSAGILAALGLSGFILLRARPPDGQRGGPPPAVEGAPRLSPSATPLVIRQDELSLPNGTLGAASTTLVPEPPVSKIAPAVPTPKKKPVVGPAATASTPAPQANVTGAASARRGLADRVPF